VAPAPAREKFFNLAPAAMALVPTLLYSKPTVLKEQVYKKAGMRIFSSNFCNKNIVNVKWKSKKLSF
jgi:hypothetical protein